MTVSLRGYSHPPNPGRAKTRLFPGGDGEQSCLALSKTSRLSFIEADGGVAAIREGCTGLIAAVAFGDGETHCSTVRSDKVQDGPSCGAKPRYGHAGYPSLEQKAPSTSAVCS